MHFSALPFVPLFLFVLVMVLQAADGYLTWRVLVAGGRELNPLVRFLIDRMGLVPGLALAKVTLAILTALFLFDHLLLLLLVVVLYLFVVRHNLKQLNRGSRA